MICSSVVQKGLHAPALWDSLGFSMGWKLPALSLLDRHRAPSRRPRGCGIREISNCCKKNIHPFFFFVVLTCSTTSCSCTRSGVQMETRPGCSAPIRANFRFWLLCPGTSSLYKGGINIQECGNTVVTLRYLQPHQLPEECRKALPRCGHLCGHGNRRKLQPWITVDRLFLCRQGQCWV